MQQVLAMKTLSLKGRGVLKGENSMKIKQLSRLLYGEQVSVWTFNDSAVRIYSICNMIYDG